MNKIGLVLMFLIGQCMPIFAQPSTGGSRAYPMESLDNFKKRIGLDGIRKSWDRGEFIFHFNNINLLNCPELKGKWTYLTPPVVNPIWESVGGQMRFNLICNKENIQFEFFCYDYTTEHYAEDRMLTAIASNSSGTIPFEVGPRDIGDLSLVRFDQGEVCFLSKNVYVVVNRFGDKQTDIVKVARWISKQLVKESKYSAGECFPRPNSEVIKHNDVSQIRQKNDLPNDGTQAINAISGDSIEMELDLSQYSDSDIRVSEVFDNKVFNVTSNGRSWVIHPQKTGQNTFTYVVINKKTLAASYFYVPINVIQ